MWESNERDWSRVTQRSLIWVVSGTVVPEMLTELGVIGILLLQDTMSIRDGRDRRSVKSEKDWAQDGPLGHTRSYVREGRAGITNLNRLSSVMQIGGNPVRPKQEERRLMRIL